ncbi:MAG: response regulator transcription factor [Saprospiraceae bacterium]|nr:response regulator transcription factor [Saprospiraceae bacterium]
MKLLLVEDQSGMAQSLKQGLEENNIQVDIANNGKIGKELFEQNGYDVIVLDVMMPEISGLELCSYIRSIGNSVPILIISALDNVEDKVIGFEVGGDDYLTKPFAFSEFLARIKALDRRNHAQKNVSRLLNIHDLHINFDNKTIQRNQVNIELTPKEFRLLEYFIKNEGRVLPKQEISENVWDVDFDTGTNVVEVYVNYLRNKLDKGFDKKLIHTKFGVGYVFNPQ